MHTHSHTDALAPTHARTLRDTHLHAHTKKHTSDGQTITASDIVKAKSPGEDPRATGGLVSNLPHPWVNEQSNTCTANDAKYSTNNQMNIRFIVDELHNSKQVASSACQS